MKKLCPYCKVELKDNGYIKDTGINNLSYLELITKDSDYRKHHFEVNCYYCPQCGHLELVADIENEYSAPKDNESFGYGYNYRSSNLKK